MVQIQHECKLEINIDEYVESTVRPFLMDVIYCWSKVIVLRPLFELVIASMFFMESSSSSSLVMGWLNDF